MKKSLLIVAIAGLAMASCKKEYTCECTMTGNGVTTTATAKSGKMKKKDAESWCNTGDSESMGYKTECSIK